MKSSYRWVKKKKKNERKDQNKGRKGTKKFGKEKINIKRKTIKLGENRKKRKTKQNKKVQQKEDFKKRLVKSVI